MFLKLSLLVTAFITLFIPSKIFALESCGSIEPSIVRFIKQKNNSFKLISTKKVKVDSDLKEDFIKSLFEAESTARIKILRFLYAQVIDDGVKSIEFHPVKISEPPSLDEQLNKMVTTSKCRIGKEYVQVSVEFYPKNIKFTCYLTIILVLLEGLNLIKNIIKFFL